MFDIIDCNIDCHVRRHKRGCDGFVFVQYNAYSVRENLWSVFGTQSYNTVGRLITHFHYLNNSLSNSHCPVCGFWGVHPPQFTRKYTKKFIRIVIFVFKTHVAAFHSVYMDGIFIHDFGPGMCLLIDWDIESIFLFQKSVNNFLYTYLPSAGVLRPTEYGVNTPINYRHNTVDRTTTW